MWYQNKAIYTLTKKLQFVDAKVKIYWPTTQTYKISLPSFVNSVIPSVNIRVWYQIKLLKSQLQHFNCLLQKLMAQKANIF